jgi:isopenicillin-N N-acyltransferase-like protein
MPEFPRISVSGTPFECGQQYGEAARQQIHFNLERYWKLLKKEAFMDRGLAMVFIPYHLEAIEKYSRDIFDEMRGIASGANLTLEEVAVLNCRSELLAHADDVSFVECTSLYAAPESTTGETLLAQNWDWYDLFRGGTVLLQIEQQGKPTVLTLTEAGIVGKIGMNSAGIGICLNLLKSRKKGNGVPIHVMLRKGLEAKQPNLASEAIYCADRAGSGNVIIAHREGEAVDFEITPDFIGLLYPQDGLLVHTNHFLSPSLQAGDLAIAESQSSIWRYGRALRLLRLMNGQITVEGVKEILRDHFSSPYCICRHPELIPDNDQPVATLASVIMDLSAGEMHVSAGEPCREAYTTYRIGGQG